MKKLLFLLCGLLLFFGFTQNVSASLIGDEVSAKHFYNGSQFGATASAIVTADDSDILIPLNTNYFVDVGADGFNVEFDHTGSWAASSSLVVSDFDDSSGNTLQNVSVSTNLTCGWPETQILRFSWADA